MTVTPPPFKFTFIPALVNVPVNAGLILGANVASVDVNEFAVNPYMTSYCYKVTICSDATVRSDRVSFKYIG